MIANKTAGHGIKMIYEFPKQFFKYNTQFIMRGDMCDNF